MTPMFDFPGAFRCALTSEAIGEEVSRDDRVQLRGSTGLRTSSRRRVPYTALWLARFVRRQCDFHLASSSKSSASAPLLDRRSGSTSQMLWELFAALVQLKQCAKVGLSLPGCFLRVCCRPRFACLFISHQLHMNVLGMVIVPAQRFRPIVARAAKP